MSDTVNERGNLMESLFFKRQDQALLQRLRDQRKKQELVDQMASASGLKDTVALEALIKVGVTADSLTALSMIPLVSVAWADREMQANEKAAILTAADAAGIAKDSPASELLSAWLVEPPEGDLLDAWKGYIAAVKQSADDNAISQLKSSVLDTAKSVAEAAGGILGFGNKTSEAEQKVLEDLASAF